MQKPDLNLNSMIWKKDKCPANIIMTIVIYVIKLFFHLYMFAMAGQMAESYGLNFSKELLMETLGDDIS